MTDNPLPLTIISGYLGTGKTTFVNHLLRHADGRRLMVLVNDFGDLPIDADLIESAEGDTINLANGCACCSMGGDLFNALVTALDASPRPDHLLIEASGVADPARIADIARAEPDLDLDAIISLVDAETLTTMIDDALVGETLVRQLAASDLILINKCDLIEGDDNGKLQDLLHIIAPQAQIIETRFARLPVDLALGVALHVQGDIEPADTHHSHGDIYDKWSMKTDQPTDRLRFEQAMDNLDANVLRLKGFVAFSGDTTTYSVQSVGKRWELCPASSAKSHDKQTRLVAIGLAGHLDKSMLDKLFGGDQSCVD